MYNKNYGSWVYKLSWKESAILWFGGALLFIVVLWFLRRAFKNSDESFDRMFKKNRALDLTKVATESKGETACRQICQKLFGIPFTKIRPDWLRNNVTGYNLELDIYNDNLKLAVEYNGKQHYEYVPHFHRQGKEQFRNQQYRDEIKRMLCRENGIRLIEIPHTIKLEDLESFIRIKCAEMRIPLGRPLEDEDEDENEDGTEEDEEEFEDEDEREDF